MDLGLATHVKHRSFLSIVQDGVRDDQALDGLAAENVGVDNFIDVRGADATVPDGVRIHDDGGTELALFEAPRFIGAHSVAGNSALGQLRFEYAVEFRFPARVAAAARVALGTLIRANEDVSFKLCHEPFPKFPEPVVAF
jgi:hypothetical protein